MSRNSLKPADHWRPEPSRAEPSRTKQWRNATRLLRLVWSLKNKYDVHRKWYYYATTFWVPAASLHAVNKNASVYLTESLRSWWATACWQPVYFIISFGILLERKRNTVWRALMKLIITFTKIWLYTSVHSHLLSWSLKRWSRTHCSVFRGFVKLITKD